MIQYSTLWSSTGHDLGEDPVADVILRLEEALTQGLNASDLPAHPSHTEFPGKSPQMLLGFLIQFPLMEINPDSPRILVIRVQEAV